MLTGHNTDTEKCERLNSYKVQTPLVAKSTGGRIGHSKGELKNDGKPKK